MAANGAKVNLQQKYGKFTDRWSAKILAQINEMQLKAVKIKGEFVWHSHPETDEMFLVHKGRMVMRLRDGDVTLDAGELYVVPRGVEHCPFAEEECEVLLLEPVGTANTGDAGGARTVEPEWI